MTGATKRPVPLDAPITPEDSVNLRIVVQDPSVKVGGRILTASVAVPAEHLDPGPWGHRVQVVDYDASSRTYWTPLAYAVDRLGRPQDPFATASDQALLANPRFHQQNVYAIVMRTLATFERVLGRRIGWGFHAHQLKVAPHAFQDANAFYSDRDAGLFFGYFTAGRDPVFTCLSHDVIAHETAHALLDGLRTRFTDPSSSDQAAFHEGFADVVALLSVFQLPEVVGELLAAAGHGRARRVPRRLLRDRRFVSQVLFGLAKEMGSALQLPGRVLRRSYDIEPDRRAYDSREFAEPHRRGELLVAAMLRAFVRVWQARLEPLGVGGHGPLDRERVVEEGAAAAQHLLGIAIRGIDYTPPVHLTFGDYLSAILTADQEVQPDDSRFEYRRKLRESFAEWGIAPSASTPRGNRAERAARAPGLWCPVDGRDLSYHGVHQEAMRRDPDEVFRFLWENRRPLRLKDEAYSQVLSVRPCRRVAPDGAPLQETVVEFSQTWEVTRRERRKLGLDAPAPEGDDEDGTTRLVGGATLLFDDFGRLKYFIHNSVGNLKRQGARLRYERESALRGLTPARRFDELHRRRALDDRPCGPEERW